MSLFKEDLKNNTGHSPVLNVVVLLLIIIQVCFVPVVYSGIVEKDVGLNNAKNIDKDIDSSSIVAELNGIPISTQDLLKRYNLFLLMAGAPAFSGDRIPVNTYLDSYLIERLLLREAKKTGISVNKNEVEQEKKRYLEKNDLTEDEFLKNLSSFKLSEEDAYRYFENNLLIIKFGGKKFGYRDISDEEAREYYNKNNQYFNSPEKITVSHILICHKESKGCLSDLDKKQAKELAEYVRKMATPANFAQLAKQFSTDRTGADGGDLGNITRGSAVPAFEKAAFALGKGEISDVVETEFGFHIIYIRGKQKARSTTFKEAKEAIKKDLREDYIVSELMNYSGQLLKTAKIKKFTPGSRQGVEVAASGKKVAGAGKKKSSAPSRFRTFKSTGEAANINSKGQPIILFFSRADCSHCQWISETFDTTVMEYVEKGLIEAHHYDIISKDDLLTPVHESEIPQKYLKIKEERSPDLVPYFNFGGRYERLGTGYEAQDDFFAEELEMRQVIDALLK